MVKWDIKYNAENPDAPEGKTLQMHVVTVYAKTLAEALDKVESFTGSKIVNYGFNFEELRNGIR